VPSSAPPVVPKSVPTTRRLAALGAGRQATRRRATAGRRRAPAPAAFASQSDQQQQQQQQQQQTSTSPQQQQVVDTDLYHYLPRWLSPWTVGVAGALALAASVAAELSESGAAAEEGLSPRAVAVAAAPVAALLFLALFVLPRQFERFASEYAREHPDVLARAEAEAAEAAAAADEAEERSSSGTS